MNKNQLDGYELKKIYPRVSLALESIIISGKLKNSSFILKSLDDSEKECLVLAYLEDCDTEDWCDFFVTDCVQDAIKDFFRRAALSSNFLKYELSIQILEKRSHIFLSLINFHLENFNNFENDRLQYDSEELIFI